MTVKELMLELQNCKQTDLVVLASDEEGNAYKTLEFVSSDEFFDPESEYVYDAEELVEMKEDGEYIPRTKSCVVLAP